MSKAQGLPRVWCIGLGRTGTRSFCDAMTILGYKNVIHVPPFITDLDNADAAAEGICMSHYRYMDLRFPNSKFVLTTRDLDSWLNSCRRAFEQFPKERIESDSPYYNAMIRNRSARYGTLEFDEPTLVERFYNHHADVVSLFKNRPHQLLIIDLTKTDPWLKLCPFLGVEKPVVPFPHVKGKDKLR